MKRLLSISILAVAMGCATALLAADGPDRPGAAERPAAIYVIGVSGST